MFTAESTIKIAFSRVFLSVKLTERASIQEADWIVFIIDDYQVPADDLHGHHLVVLPANLLRMLFFRIVELFKLSLHLI